MRRVLAASVSLSVLVGLPCAAVAQEEWAQATTDARGAALDPSVALDRKYDMRADPSTYVSDVKYQTPWGNCWSFGATAAAESSIFTDLGKRVDLSERHLAWFAYTPIAAVDDPTQVGEGIYFVEPYKEPNGRFDGGSVFDVLRTYTSGAGPVLESAWPYHGKESLTELEAITNGPEGWKQLQFEKLFGKMSDEEILEFLDNSGYATVDEYLERVLKRTRRALEKGDSPNHYPEFPGALLTTNCQR